MIRRLLYSLFRLLPIKRDRVLFISYYGAQYGCNPKYISLSLIARYRGRAEVVWAFTDPSARKVDGARTVRYNSAAYLLMLATSRVVVTNYRMTLDFRKRPGQTYIQTWHSSLRLKKIEGDTVATLPPHYVEMARHDSAQTDYVIAGCRKSHDTFRDSFWYSGEILDCGTPRNDLLLSGDPALADDIRRRLGVAPGRRVALYAPTFRKDKSTDCYRLDFARLCESLRARFGGEWTVVLRLHPHLSGCPLFRDIDNVVDVTSYDDIQELLLAGDILVSDYSSLIFDFAITGRPVFLFATDVDEYCRNDRALYFDIARLPFPLATGNDDLAERIASFDSRRYRDLLGEFDRSVGSYETGTASDRLADLIIRACSPNFVKSEVADF